MHDVGVQDPLKHQLSACSELLDELKNVLQQETASLWHRDFKVLAETTQKKASLVAQIEAAEHDVSRLLANSDLSLDKRETSDESPELHAIRQTFLDTLQTCRYLNQLNGSSIDASRTLTTQLLDILKGDVRKNVRYGTDGRIKAEEPTPSPPLATA